MTELEKWEGCLREALDGVDRALEAKYAGRIGLRAQRPAAGTTASPKYDGLFAVNAAFSLGIATGLGPGYIIDIRVSSALPLSAAVKEEILRDAEAMLPSALSAAFPQRRFELSRIGDKLHLGGDLELS